MAGRVLLISINECDDPYPVFPLGLGYIDSALQASGYLTRWIDFRLNGEALPSVVAEFQPDYVGISIRNIDDIIIRRRHTYFGRLVSICPQLRQLTRAPIILGGSGFSIFPRELMELTRADFGISGEGERSLLKLIATLESGGNLAAVPGLVHFAENRLLLNPREKRPAEIRGPRRPPDVSRHYLGCTSMLNVQTQRGCGHRCCYCTYPLIEGRAWRKRNPQDVAREMAALQDSGAKYLFIVDSVFNSSREHAAAVCEAILEQGVQIQWGCFLRPQGLTAELMALMRRAGLTHIEFGSDSFSDTVLSAYDKRLTFADIQAASELARREKVDFCHFLICGGPGETRGTMEETFTNSQKLDGAVILALVGMRVYPHTALFKRAVAEGVIEAGADLLAPQYYVSPNLEQQQAFELLQDFSRRSPNWIVGDPSPAYVRMAGRLRAKGVIGPLWGYFAAMQRLLLNSPAPAA